MGLRLHLPSGWTIKQHPQAAAIEEATLTWLDAKGLTPTESLRQRVRRMEVAGYGGHSYPEGSFKAALLYSKYITLWLLWDDVAIEKNPGMDLTLTLQAVAGIQPVVWHEGETVDPLDQLYAQAWFELTDEFRDFGVDAAWQARLGQGMTQWVVAARKEATMSSDGGGMSSKELLKQRLITIGMFPMAQILEVETKAGMTAEDIDTHPELRICLATSAAVVAYANELMSVGKDIAANWLNLVVVDARRRGEDMKVGFKRWADRLVGAMRTYDEAASTLPAKWQLWAQRLRLCCGGFAHWHTICSRYVMAQPPGLQLELIAAGDDQ